LNDAEPPLQSASDLDQEFVDNVVGKHTGRPGRAVQRSIHDAHGEDCTDAAEGNAMPTI
jgi:hypothetical protein